MILSFFRSFKITKSPINLKFKIRDFRWTTMLNLELRKSHQTRLAISLVMMIYYTRQIHCIEDAILKKAKVQIEQDILKMKNQYGTQMASYPNVIYSTRGPKYQLEFLIDQRKCDIFTVLVSALDVLSRGKESAAFQVTNIDSMKEDSIFTVQVQFTESSGNPKSRIVSKGTIYISGEMTNERPNFKLIYEKSGDISDLDIKAFVEAYREANKPRNYSLLKQMPSEQMRQVGQQKNQEVEKSDAIKKLEELGVTIFLPEQKVASLDWDYLAGYEKQKRDIEDTVLLALSYPEVYDKITLETRVKNEPNRPKAVLFEGPPGTGKTTSAKIISQQVKIPLIYMPIESIMSKFYGESEKRFADLWDACQKMGRCIIFIDEIDAIAQSRDSEMHEASRRILSTLLRKIDSFESTSNVLLICATNRRQDLDAAMLSRLDLSVKFELPDEHSRAAIFQRYAKHLTGEDRIQLAQISFGMSGRNISDVCKDAERRWAAKIIRKETEETLPNLQQYIDTLNARVSNSLS